MADITYGNKLDIRGKAVADIATEILFENNTISKRLVTFEDDIKANTIFTEADAQAELQAYTTGVPTSAGSLSAWDTLVTPAKGLFYHEFNTEGLRLSRFKRDMAKGAWNTFSDEFSRVVIGGIYAKRISLAMENEFWNGINSGTKTAIAGLTPGTAQTSIGAEEQALAASLTSSAINIDGIVAKLMYNDSNASASAGVGGRVKVAGTTITASNIKAEYDKLYAAIPSVLLSGAGEKPVIYAPYSHKQLIVIQNNNSAAYKDTFAVSGDMYSFNGVEIKFVPIPENVMICALKSSLVWLTDAEADYAYMKLEPIAANSDELFIKNVMAIGTHVRNQAFNVLYVG